MVYVGPRLSMTAANADDFLMVPPGAEHEVALAMLQVMLDEGWAQGDVAAVRKIASEFPKPRLPDGSLDRARPGTGASVRAVRKQRGAGRAGRRVERSGDVNGLGRGAAQLRGGPNRPDGGLLPRPCAQPRGNERAGAEVPFRTRRPTTCSSCTTATRPIVSAARANTCAAQAWWFTWARCRTRPPSWPRGCCRLILLWNPGATTSRRRESTD